MLFSTYGQIDKLKEVLKKEFEWSDSKIENYFKDYIIVEGSRYCLTSGDREKRCRELWEMLCSKFTVVADVGYENGDGLYTDLDDIILIPKNNKGSWIYISR